MALHCVRLRIRPCQGLLCNTYVPSGPLTWRIEPDQTSPAHSAEEKCFPHVYLGSPTASEGSSRRNAQRDTPLTNPRRASKGRLSYLHPMTLTREDLNPCTVKLTIVCDPEEVKEGFERALKQISKNIRLPGFRPGHAPRAMVEPLIGK